MNGRFRALLLALAMAACATLREAPQVALVGIEPGAVSPTEQQFILRLRVSNPNAVELPIERVDFTMDVDGRPFAAGQSLRPVRVPPRGEALLDLRAASDLGRFLRQFRGWGRLAREGVEVRAKGTLTVEGYGPVPFDKRLRLNLPGLPGTEENAPARPLPGAV